MDYIVYFDGVDVEDKNVVEGMLDDTKSTLELIIPTTEEKDN